MLSIGEKKEKNRLLVNILIRFLYCLIEPYSSHIQHGCGRPSNIEGVIQLQSENGLRRIEGT